MIHIGKPYIQAENSCTRLCAEILLDGQRQTAWFAVEPAYAQFLTDDRADAFVIGFLTTAMRKNEDIVCSAPITKRLKHQLNQILIPIISANKPYFHKIQIHAETTSALLPSEHAVGTGWTGGVDCTYT